jgi:sec-independent protein translocase protein TatB
VGHLFGKAQRYVSDVKAEVNRSIELDELKKMKTQFEDAARDVQGSVQKEVQDASQSFESDWRSATAGIEGAGGDAGAVGDLRPPPVYRPPKKNWRLKRGATPQWYKQRQGVRTKAQSGAARVARFRPPGVR